MAPAGQREMLSLAPSHTALMAEDLAACPHPSILLVVADCHQPWLIRAMGEQSEAQNENLKFRICT